MHRPELPHRRIGAVALHQPDAQDVAEGGQDVVEHAVVGGAGRLPQAAARAAAARARAAFAINHALVTEDAQAATSGRRLSSTAGRAERPGQRAAAPGGTGGKLRRCRRGYAWLFLQSTPDDSSGQARETRARTSEPYPGQERIDPSRSAGAARRLRGNRRARQRRARPSRLSRTSRLWADDRDARRSVRRGDADVQGHHPL